jgi:hypothetical protein
VSGLCDVRDDLQCKKGKLQYSIVQGSKGLHGCVILEMSSCMVPRTEVFATSNAKGK